MIELVTRKMIGEESSEVTVFFDSTDETSRKGRRAHERAVVKQCLELILESKDVEIGHAESGAPFLKKYPELEISLSHSTNWYAFQISNTKNVGVDIQVFRKNGLYKGRSYFVNEQEEKTIELTDENLHVIWAVKEAVYKYKKGLVAQYKESITVLTIGKNCVSVTVDGEVLECGVEISEDHVLVYTV